MASGGFVQTRLIDDEILVVTLHGNLDAITINAFETEIQRHLSQGTSKIIVDCENLGFMTSTGIGSLVVLQSRLRKQGGALKLVAVHGIAAEVMKLVQLDRVVEGYSDVESAVQSFHG
jgi:anti-sigma B factor antagonist